MEFLNFTLVGRKDETRKLSMFAFPCNNAQMQDKQRCEKDTGAPEKNQGIRSKGKGQRLKAKGKVIIRIDVSRRDRWDRRV
jgi:hypothetical protein